MTHNPEAIVAAARRWVGTPFHHRGRIRGAGADCIGLIAGIAEDVGITVPKLPDYPAIPASNILEPALEKFGLKAIEQLELGCVVTLWTRGRVLVAHAAVVSNLSPVSLIHATPHGVVEHVGGSLLHRCFSRMYRLPQPRGGD